VLLPIHEREQRTRTSLIMLPAASTPSAGKAAGSGTAAKVAPAGTPALTEVSRGAPASLDAVKGAATISESPSFASSTTQLACPPAITHTAALADSAAIPCASSISDSFPAKFLPALLHPSTKSLARLQSFRRAPSVEFLRGSLVPIGHAFAVFGIVLPLTLTVSIHLPLLLPFLLVFVAVNVLIEVVVLVDVNIDVSTVPVTVTPRVSPRHT
jgi:hypothetical protein